MAEGLAERASFAIDNEGHHTSNHLTSKSNTVCGYKFNHMATNLTTLAAFRLALLKGQPLLLEGWSENKNIRQNANIGACF